MSRLLKLKWTWVIIATMLLCVGIVVAVVADETKDEVPGYLLGRWKLIAVEEDLERSAPIDRVEYEFGRHEVILREGRNRVPMKVRVLNAADKSGTVEAKFRWDDEDYVMRGVYRIIDGRMQLCFRRRLAGEVFSAPHSFETKRDDDIVLYEFERTRSK